jgi:hypothetical protein
VRPFAFVACALLACPAALAAQAAPPAVLGDWSATIGGSQWDLHFDAAGQYSIMRVGAAGDTLVLSMGSWSAESTSICIRPPGREPICGPLVIRAPDAPERTEWRFAEPATGFGWAAYRRGYAPWDRWVPGREGEVYDLSDVAVRPQFLGCERPLMLPDGRAGPIRVLARLVVEPDSSVSAVEIVDAPDPAVFDAAHEIASSCRLAPGVLHNGRIVRVRVEFPIEFPG